MKIIYLISISVFVIIFFSCKKDEEIVTNTKNHAPVLSEISNQTVTSGKSESIGLIATDVDEDSLLFSITSGQRFLSITNRSQTGNKATATLIIEPEENDEGSYTVSIQVSDGKGGTDSKNLIITVVAPPFSISDIVGIWSGNMQNSINNFTVVISIDNEGNASGVGAGGDFEFSDDEWTINDKGQVAGSGAVVIYSSGMITVQGGTWSLQLNQSKDILTGEFSCDALGTMEVNLIKQSDEPDEPDEPELTVTDYDGNVYNTVTIGTQVWMKENLRAVHYSDGTAIDSVFDHSESNTIYGRLYHWPAAMNHSTTESAQGACPTGWHIPSKAEFDELIDYLGGKEVAGGKLKATGTSLWLEPNEGATNESGFTALPAGWNFYAVGQEANFWSSTIYNETQSYRLELSHDISGINKYGEAGGKNEAISVRCIKD